MRLTAGEIASLLLELAAASVCNTGAGVAGAGVAGAGLAQAPAPKAKLIINTILFDLNSSAVRPEQTIMLQEAANELKQNPDNAVVIEHLGDVYLKLGEIEDARSQWKRALDMDEDNERLKTKIENIRHEM